MLYERWIAGGLDPAPFWRATPGLVAMTLRGLATAARERAEAMRAQAWMTAMLTRAQKMPEFETWVRGRRNDLAACLAAWDKVDRALEANMRRRG